MKQLIKFILRIKGFWKLYQDYEYDGGTLDFIIRNYKAVLENRTELMSKPTYHYEDVMKQIDRWYANAPKWYEYIRREYGED